MQKIEYSHVQPFWRFVLLSLVTFGIYQIFWFYRHWKFLKVEYNLIISPFWRAVFCPLFAGNLAGSLKKYLKEKDCPSDFSPLAIGVSFFFLSLSHKLPDPYWLISNLTFAPILPLVDSMNNFWKTEEQELPLKKFRWWQILLIIFGGLFFVLSVFGAFIPE